MNITFLIGNGFDVGVGMKSRFKDFFPIYQIQSKDKPENIKQLAQSIGADYETWADFEIALGAYTNKFTSSTKNDLIAQVMDFEDDFIKYLKKQEEALLFDESVVKNTIVEALTGFYKSPILPEESTDKIFALYQNNSSQEHRYNFVTFNYTSVLEKCLEILPNKEVRKRNNNIDKIGEVVHVHGAFDNSPIIGVNDASQLLNQDLAADKRFSDLLIKPNLNKLLKKKFDKNASSLIDKSQIVCVYGMSLGSTDKKWWQLLLSWLSKNSSRQLIIFDYDDQYSLSNQFGWPLKEYAIIDKLTSFAEEPDKINEDITSRIHIAVHKNIFKMDLMKRHNDIIEKAKEMVHA